MEDCFETTSAMLLGRAVGVIFTSACTTPVGSFAATAEFTLSRSPSRRLATPGNSCRSSSVTASWTTGVGVASGRGAGTAKDDGMMLKRASEATTNRISTIDISSRQTNPQPGKEENQNFTPSYLHGAIATVLYFHRAPSQRPSACHHRRHALIAPHSLPVPYLHRTTPREIGPRNCACTPGSPC
jgi:hypothetical protein